MIDRTKAPELKSFSSIRLDYPPVVTLDNGIPLQVVGKGVDEVNRLTAYVGGGSLHEPMNMLASLTAAMIFEGNDQMTAQEVAETIDYYGSWRQTQGYDDCVGISLSSLNDNFSHTLPVLLRCLTNPAFPEAEYERIKERLASNCALARERVKYLANAEMNRLYYGESHPLAREATPEGIMAMKIDDVKAFHRRYYNPQNCRLIFAGNITERELATLNNVIGSWILDGEPCEEAGWVTEPSDKMFSAVNKSGAVQAAIVMTCPTVGRQHKHYFAVRMLTTALGGYFGSRLMTNIREQKGMTYGISAVLSGRKHDAYIGITTECDPRYSHDVIAEVKNEVERLRTEPILPAELNIIKQHMLSDLAKTLDTPFSIASYVGSTHLYGVYPEYFNKQVDYIINATSEQLQEAARLYLNPDNLRTVIAGDLEKVGIKG